MIISKRNTASKDLALREADLRKAIANVHAGETVPYNSAVCISVGPGGTGKTSTRRAIQNYGMLAQRCSTIGGDREDMQFVKAHRGEMINLMVAQNVSQVERAVRHAMVLGAGIANPGIDDKIAWENLTEAFEEPEEYVRVSTIEPRSSMPYSSSATEKPSRVTISIDGNPKLFQFGRATSSRMSPTPPSNSTLSRTGSSSMTSPRAPQRPSTPVYDSHNSVLNMRLTLAYPDCIGCHTYRLVCITICFVACCWHVGNDPLRFPH